MTAIESFWQQIIALFEWYPFQLGAMILVATLHGYGAAWLAVRMLFRPYKSVKLFGITIFPQGMIPRHRDRLAAAIGRAVGNELVSQDTLVDALFSTDFLQRKISGVVNSYIDDLVHQDLPSVIESLPPHAREVLLETVASLQHHIAGYITENLKSEETAGSLDKFVGEQLNNLLSQRVSQVVDEETFTQIHSFLEQRLRGVLSEKALKEKVRDFVNLQVDELALSEIPLRDMVAPEAADFVKERLKGQVQPIVHHLAEIATQENTRERIGSLVKTEINDYYNQLSFFQKFFVSRDKINREVDNLVNNSLPKKVDDFLRGEVFADEAEGFLASAIDSVLSRPLPELTGQIAPEKMDELKGQISDAILKMVESQDMQTSLSAYLSDMLYNIRPHSLKAIAERVHPEATAKLRGILVSGLLDLLQRDETLRMVNATVANQIEHFLIMPIGKLSDRIPEEALRRAADALTESIVAAAKEKLPAAIAELDIGNIVREKVDAYPLEKLEELVLSVAREHLRKIELCGLVLGFIIGAVQAVFVYFTFVK
ncbi:MAG TPA: DUF445 family protein [Pyrinomonadaceae bacterium]|nr:DUF445 family protein [Pyrinomonadaceae bacterium]